MQGLVKGGIDFATTITQSKISSAVNEPQCSSSRRKTSCSEPIMIHTCTRWRAWSADSAGHPTLWGHQVLGCRSVIQPDSVDDRGHGTARKHQYGRPSPKNRDGRAPSSECRVAHVDHAVAHWWPWRLALAPGMPCAVQPHHPGAGMAGRTGEISGPPPT